MCVLKHCSITGYVLLMSDILSTFQNRPVKSRWSCDVRGVVVFNQMFCQGLESYSKYPYFFRKFMNFGLNRTNIGTRLDGWSTMSRCFYNDQYIYSDIDT